MAATLRASLLALLLAGSLLPLAGLAVLEYRAVSVERVARERADMQAEALAAALRVEDASARGEDPASAAGADARFVGPDGTEWPAFRALAGQRLSGVDALDGELVAWARVPSMNADLVLVREPSPTSLATLFPFLLLAAFLAGGLALLLAFIGTRVLAPVARLEKASQRLARGEWHERVAVKGPAEVRALALAFNEMARALEAQRGHLDALLEERTRALIDRETDLDALRFTLAHEFREPLRSLRWMADDLLERRLAPDARDAVLILRRRIEDIDAVFRDLLRYEDVSRRDAPMEDVALERVLEVALPMAAESGPILVDGPPLPIVRGNADLLNVALVEILRNAAAYAREADGEAHVELSVEDDGDAFVLHVDDGGPGIPAARREDALHLFQRLRRDGPGTGAGLAIARRALERHGGDITLGESPRGGLRATLRLPREGERRPAAAERAPRRF